MESSQKQKNQTNPAKAGFVRLKNRKRSCFALGRPGLENPTGNQSHANWACNVFPKSSGAHGGEVVRIRISLIKGQLADFKTRGGESGLREGVQECLWHRKFVRIPSVVCLCSDGNDRIVSVCKWDT